MIIRSANSLARVTSRSLTILGAFLAVAIVSSTLVYANSSDTSAARKEDWVAGNIISDVAFTDNTIMSVQEIQAFLDRNIGSCDVWGTGTATEFGYNGTRAQYAAVNGWQAPPYTCLNMYYEVPKIAPGGGMPANNYSNPDSRPAESQSAAWIIRDAANRYNISPKVLLVKLATESAGPLTSDKWPLLSQYRYAMGAYCPDSGPGGSANCNETYAGFSLQMYKAAELLRYYLNSMDQAWWPYKKPGTNNILWNVVERGCGGANVNIQNKATAALYTYTPYQPNQAALDNLYGTGDNCSAYGNRNFWRVYNDWFGLSRFSIKGGILEEYNRSEGSSRLGNALMDEICGLKEGACYQNFERGSIYWTPAENRAHTLIGAIKTRWDSLGKEWGTLGYPISNEIYSETNVTQKFQNGVLHYSKNGTIVILSVISNYQSLGNPLGDTICGIRSGGCYQFFESGTVYWSNETGSYPVFGGIGAKWSSTGKEWGPLGYPTSMEEYQPSYTRQQFERGDLIYASGASHYTLSSMKYLSDFTHLGKLRSDTLCGLRNNGCYQVAGYGYIYHSPSTGAHAIFGGIYERWAQTGKEWGSLGYPTSSERYENGKVVQSFENGSITWTGPSQTSVQYN